jgi:hypothetical protein
MTGIVLNLFICKMRRMANRGESTARDESDSVPQFPWLHRAAHDDQVTDADFVELCAVSEADAAQCIAKLEAVAIECRRSDSPSEQSSVSSHSAETVLLVRRDHLEAARDVMNDQHASHSADEDDPEFEKTARRQMIANYICPICRKRTLDLVPLTPFWRRFYFILVLLIIVLAGVMVIMYIPMDPAPEELDQIRQGLLVALISSATVLGIAVAFLPRSKQCTKCNWQTKSEDSQD